MVCNNKIEGPLEKMAKSMGVSRSGYYRFLKRDLSRREQDNTRLLKKILGIHQESREIYGSPRIHAELKEKGESCSRQRGARLMRKTGISGKVKPRVKVTTKGRVQKPLFLDLVRRHFITRSPHKVWVGDITYIPTREGWLYLAVVLDLFSRRVVGMAMSSRLYAEIVVKALSHALCHRKGRGEIIHHSDRGSQYTSQAFRQFALKKGVRLSMSETGSCFDNAVAESFFHTLKTECVYSQTFHSREEAQQAIFDYVEVFYNRKRRHSTLGYVPPVTFENNWHDNQNVCVQTVY